MVCYFIKKKKSYISLQNSKSLCRLFSFFMLHIWKNAFLKKKKHNYVHHTFSLTVWPENSWILWRTGHCLLVKTQQGTPLNPRKSERHLGGGAWISEGTVGQMVCHFVPSTTPLNIIRASKLRKAMEEAKAHLNAVACVQSFLQLINWLHEWWKSFHMQCANFMGD